MQYSFISPNIVSWCSILLHMLRHDLYWAILFHILTYQFNICNIVKYITIWSLFPSIILYVDMFYIAQYESICRFMTSKCAILFHMLTCSLYCAVWSHILRYEFIMRNMVLYVIVWIPNVVYMLTFGLYRAGCIIGRNMVYIEQYSFICRHMVHAARYNFICRHMGL